MFERTLETDDLHFSTGTGNEEKKQIINQYIHEYIFPSSFRVTVQPGGVINFVCALDINVTDNWKWALGYDFYAQQQECVKSIHNTTVEPQTLRLKDAQSPSVRQHKIFSELMYHKKQRKGEVGIGLGGDITVASKDIGEDWTAYLKIAASF